MIAVQKSCWGNCETEIQMDNFHKFGNPKKKCMELFALNEYIQNLKKQMRLM